jgi:hypothetical protein
VSPVEKKSVSSLSIPPILKPGLYVISNADCQITDVDSGALSPLIHLAFHSLAFPSFCIKAMTESPDEGVSNGDVSDDARALANVANNSPANADSAWTSRRGKARCDSCRLRNLKVCLAAKKLSRPQKTE